MITSFFLSLFLLENMLKEIHVDDGRLNPGGGFFLHNGNRTSASAYFAISFEKNHL